MPLPLEDCVDDIPTDVCCPTLFDIADRIRCIATDAVLRCVDTRWCTERGFRSIVAMSPHADFFGDLLSVCLVDHSVDSASDERGKTLPVLLTRGDFRLELTETGWPVHELDEQDNLVYAPEADLINALARHAYSHGEAMHRALLDVAARRQFWTSNIGLPTDRFSAFQVGSLRPLPPQGRLVGWGIDVRVRFNPGPGMAGS